MSFELERFTLQLLSETLFYDEETGAFGGVTLVDEEQGKEMYFASFEPGSDAFVIEKAIEWEKVDTDDDGAPDFQMGVDGEEHGSYETADEAAAALLSLAREQNLSPNVVLNLDLDDEDLEDEESAEA